MPKKKFYITTSIAYTNAPPHLGYALETIQADVLARYHCTLGEDVFFLTGTDEHGRKVAEAAEKAGKSPESFVNEISSQFKELTKALNLSNNDFIRTTDKVRHWPEVKKVWLKLKENGDIYKKKYKGLYCVGCEAFITKKDLIDGKCHIHKAEPEVVEEENYFFKLSKYSKKIEEFLKKDKIKIIPASRKNEMLSFAKQGLADISFSRPRKDLRWGIPVPGDETQTIYVWADALTNYLSGAPGRWPANVQCIGKDIQKFHCLIWPAMLLSLGLPLPKTILVHGFITVAGQKISKSLGNVIDPFELVKKYGADAVRYFLLREIAPTEDGDYTEEKFIKRYNSDLASGLGNLVARVLRLAENFGVTKTKDHKSLEIKTAHGTSLGATLTQARLSYTKTLNEFKFNETLFVIWELIGFCDSYVDQEKPWEGKNNKVIADLMFFIGEIADMLKPFLSETSNKILKQLSSKESEPLFPRI